MTRLEMVELELGETVCRLWSALNVLELAPHQQRDKAWEKRHNNLNGQLQAIQAVRGRVRDMLECEDNEREREEKFNELAGNAPMGWEMEANEPEANNDFALIRGEETPAFCST